MFCRDRKKWWTHVLSFYLKCWCTAAKPDVNNKGIYGECAGSWTFAIHDRPTLLCLGLLANHRQFLTRLLMSEQIFQNLHVLPFFKSWRVKWMLRRCITHWDCLNADSSLPAAARVSQDQTLNGADWMLFTVDGSVHLSESRSLNITPADFLFSNLTLIAEILRTSVFYTAGLKLPSVFRSVLSNTSLKGFIHKMWKTFPHQQTLPAILNTIIINLSHWTCSALLLGFQLAR